MVATHTINYREEIISSNGSSEITDGKGVPVVYDSIGKDTFEDSLDCLAAARGCSSVSATPPDPVPPFNMGILPAEGLAVHDPSVPDDLYGGAGKDLVATANELFEVVLSGAVKIEINQTYPAGRSGPGPQ